ncbi:MAG TPA: ribosomal protein L7/L12 [Ktedonobacteraceae bacterium]|nr:ribosomal protein L7/L12 [Ktedonobacteraceae bacterium]
MNIGWILLICALIILAFLAFRPQRRNDLTSMLANQDRASRLDELDTRLVRRTEVLDLLQAGQTIKAMKIYREDTGASLVDAKAAVERMAPAGPGLYSQNIPAGRVDMMDEGMLKAEVERLLMQRRTIQAIKLYREHTGLGLREARDAVTQIANAMQSGISSFAQRGELDTGAEQSVQAQQIVARPGDDVRSLLLEGKKISAIKLYREQTGLGLREAKDIVEQMERTLHLGMEQL